MKTFSKFLFVGLGTGVILHKTNWLAYARERIQLNHKQIEDDITGLKLFSVTDQSELAREIAFHLKTKIGKLQVLNEDGKGQPTVNVMEDVHSKIIYLVCTFKPDDHSTNESINNLVSTIATMKSQSPKKVNVILPCDGLQSQNEAGIGYSREDLYKLLEKAGADKIFTVNMNKSGGISKLPLVEVDAHKLCVNYFKNKGFKDVVIVSSNETIKDNIIKIKEKLEQEGRRADIGMIEEIGDSQLNYVGDSVKDRNVILVDNAVVSGKSIYDMSNYLKLNLGAKSIRMFAPHGVLDDETVDFLDHSPITELVITNTLPLEDSRLSTKIQQISVAKLLADMIAQSTFHKNLQELYQEN